MKIILSNLVQIFLQFTGNVNIFLSFVFFPLLFVFEHGIVVALWYFITLNALILYLSKICSVL